MEKILDRFLRYVSVDTQSDENSTTQPSTAKQWDLLNMLADELRALGVAVETEEHGYVYARIPANIDAQVPTVGFIAHVDTAPDASGKLHIQGCNVHPGYAKNKMRNAILIGQELNALLPVNERPEYTENYEGFFHIIAFKHGF